MKAHGKTGRIGPDGEVKIPGDYMESVGLHPGEEVEFRQAGRGLLLEPVKEAVAYGKKPHASPLDQLTGALPLDQELIEEIAHGCYAPEDV